MLSIEHAGSEAIAERRVLELLDVAGSQGRTLEDLIGSSDLAADALRTALQRLERLGSAVEWNRHWFSLRHTEWIAGWVSFVGEGGAVLRSAAGEPTHQIATRFLKSSQDGDLVVAKRLRERRPRGALLPAAAVVKVLATRPSEIVGRLVAGETGEPRFEAFDSRFLAAVELAGWGNAAPGDYVVVDLAPSTGLGPLNGRVGEVLGPITKTGVDLEVVRRHFAIPEEFSSAAPALVDRLPEDPTGADIEGREDLRRRVVVTIDGASARDFDDALSLESRRDGGWRLGVHIADVSHYVRDGDALDRDAYQRGTSAYFPERAIPMLPEKLSNGLCSLRPGVDRLTLSAFLDFDAEGRPLARRFGETVIRSARRLTYEEVARVLRAPHEHDAGDYGEVLILLRELEKLMKALLARRVERGSLDFDLPEGDVVLNEAGATIEILPSERTTAHRIVEECMIAANQAVAAELDQNECAALYRVHAPPDARRLLELGESLAAMGLAVPSGPEALSPAALQDVQSRVAGRPEEAFVAALLLRAVQRARYSPTCDGHYALAAPHYTHFTSPIRRYPDLLVHRRLRALLRGTAGEEARRTLLDDRLERIAERTSFTERRAESAERTLLQWKKARFMAPRVGEVFAGRISNVTAFGLFVQLDGLFVDGLIPIRSMTDDYYEFLPTERLLKGANLGRRFRLADPIEVVLVAVDERRRGLVFAIPGMPPPRGRATGGRGEGRAPRPSQTADRGAAARPRRTDRRRR